MQDEKACSTRWPKYAVYTYCGLGVMAGCCLIGGGVYLHHEKEGYNDLFNDILSGSLGAEIDIMLLIKITSLVVGATMVLTASTLGVCGVYKMNRSCVATYMAFVIFGMVMAAAIGLTLTAYQGQLELDISVRSERVDADRLLLDKLIRVVMYITLAISSFQLVGVVLTCCLQKAIEDINKL